MTPLSTPFNPAVLSEIPEYAPNPARAQGQALTLANAMQGYELGGVELAEKKQKQKDLARAKEVLNSADLSSFEGQTKAAQELVKINPQLGMDFLGQVQSLRTAKIEFDLKQVQLADAQMDILSGYIDPVVAQLEQKRATMIDPRTGQPRDPALLSGEAKKLSIEAALRLRREHPELQSTADRFLTGLQSAPDAYQFIRSQDEVAKRGSAAIKQRLEEMKAGNKEKADTARADREERRLALAEDRAAAGPKPPSGFEWDTDPATGEPKKDAEGSPVLKPIPGGPKDPNSKPWTGREKVFSERILTSANEASMAIENITQLPVGASSGILGVGSSPGHSVFAAGRDVLRNKMSSQETQDYNTMLAGVRRNLATIESTGLAPPGSLTEGMASLELRGGDTEYTKLRKLAEMRQIIEAGLEVQLADPAIPDAIKNVMHTALGRVRQAVPYTQKDVTTLQRDHATDPQMTLEQLISKKNLRPGTPAAGAPPGSPPPPGGTPGKASAAGGAPPDGVKPGEEWRRNPTTGEVVVLRGGKWEKVGGSAPAAP